MFELYRSEAGGTYHFRLKAPNGETILASEGYVTRGGCRRGIDSVKRNATRETAFRTRTAQDGRKYFALVAANGKTVGQSQMYRSEAGMLKGLASVRENAPCAEIRELK